MNAARLPVPPLRPDRCAILGRCPIVVNAPWSDICFAPRYRSTAGRELFLLSGEIVARNRKARYDYEIVSSLEVGIELQGSEIKSIREGKVNLKGSYATFDSRGELWVVDMHVAEYANARDNHVPDRQRKLLAHSHELSRLRRKVEEKGVTLVPLDVHMERGRAKIQLGVCRGKRQYDKRREIAKREQQRRMRAAMKRSEHDY
ncbi:SsrA-binding protein SmpB [Candidatus Fermentibacteria bacterium]|nr:SsrA-binding protein SmpB [Candidatus Fermentibacteria bacterium]